MGIQAKQSVVYGILFIIGGAIASMINNWGKKHPTMSQPLLNIDLAILAMPMISSGVLVGVYNFFIVQGMFYSLLSELHIFLILIILIVWMIYIVGIKIYRAYSSLQNESLENANQNTKIEKNEIQSPETEKKVITNNEM